MRSSLPLDQGLREQLLRVRFSWLSDDATLKPIDASFSMMVVDTLETDTAAERFLNIWFEDPLIQPHKYDAYEPMRRTFDKANLKDVVDCFRRRLLFRRLKPRIEGSIFREEAADSLQHAWMHMVSPEARQAVLRWEHLVRRVSADFAVDYCTIHQLVPEEIVFSIESGATWAQGVNKVDCDHAIAPSSLQRYLSDIYWANLFGTAYVEHFGREKLLSAPAETVEEWPNGSVYIRLSADPLDFEHDFPRMQAIRDRIKDHLGRESFFDLERGRDGKYSVPDFRLWQRRGLDSPPDIRIPEPEPLPKMNEMRGYLVSTLERWQSYAAQREPLVPVLEIDSESVYALPAGTRDKTAALAKTLIQANAESQSYILAYDGEATVNGVTTPAFVAEGAMRGEGDALLFAQRYRWAGLLRKTRELIDTPMWVGKCPSLFEEPRE